MHKARLFLFMLEYDTRVEEESSFFRRLLDVWLDYEEACVYHDWKK